MVFWLPYLALSSCCSWISIKLCVKRGETVSRYIDFHKFCLCLIIICLFSWYLSICPHIICFYVTIQSVHIMFINHCDSKVCYLSACMENNFLCLLFFFYNQISYAHDLYLRFVLCSLSFQLFMITDGFVYIFNVVFTDEYLFLFLYIRRHPTHQSILTCNRNCLSNQRIVLQ